jgi:23S rRNA (guanosine2251-2'-O)-methyltransferase
MAPRQLGRGSSPEPPRRPQAPAEKRRAATKAKARGRAGNAKADSGGGGTQAAKQARRAAMVEAARAALRPGPGQDLIEGRRPVLEALRSGRPVDRVLVAAGAGAHGALADLQALARERGVRVESVPRSMLDAAASTGANQGVLAVVAAIEPIDLDELLALPLTTREPPFFLALDGVEDPRNLGALVRSAGAAGCHGVLVPRHRSAPLSAVAVKASAGALQHVPVAGVVNLARALEHLREAGLWCIGLDTDADASLFELDLADEPVCVVVGGEGAGLHRLVRDACDLLVRIPMAGQVESLNASVAGALALFEVRRRRAGKPKLT